MPPVYPIYGHNETEHLCQIKQYDHYSEINEEFVGEYWSLRACRSAHPEIILYTGTGILLWILLLGLIVVNNFILKPKGEKKYTLDKKQVGTIWDLFVIGSILFLLILLLHYYNVPSTYYDYGSDIDQIIYYTLIYREVPLLITLGYTLVSAIHLYKNKA
jgi:hypothetical protein